MFSLAEELNHLESETPRNHHNAGLLERRSPPALSPESSALALVFHCAKVSRVQRHGPEQAETGGGG